MSSPDLEALVNGLTRLGDNYGSDDPLVQAMVSATLMFIDHGGYREGDHQHVTALRSLLD